MPGVGGMGAAGGRGTGDNDGEHTTPGYLIDVGNGRRARVAAIDGSVMATSLDHAVATAQISMVQIWDVRRTLELRTAELAAIERSDDEARTIVALAEAMEAAGVVSQPEHNGDRSVLAPPPPRG